MATRALITGGAGFIGSHLSERLLRAGYEVTIIDDLSTGQMEHIDLLRDQPGYKFVIDDMRNAMVMDRLVSETDVIIHLAAAVGVSLVTNHPIATIEINVGGTETLLKTAQRYRRTSEVYGKNIKLPFSEDDDRTLGATTLSRWGYAASKELDEFLAMGYYKELKLPVSIFRLFNTVGPRQIGRYGMVVPRFVQAALEGKALEVYGDGEQQRCFGNVYDVVDAIQRLIEHPDISGQVFNIGSSEEVSIRQLAERVIAITGSGSQIINRSYDEVYPDGGFEDMRRRIPDVRKIKQYTGWEATTPLDTTIRQMIAYYQARS
jgi:UDP-glucose 4-epimerase